MTGRMLFVGCLAAVLGCGGASLVRAENTVYSQNVVGFVKVPHPAGGTRALCAYNFSAVGGGTNTLLDIFGTNTLTTTAYNLPARADRIHIYDASSQTYVSCFMKTDGVFHLIGPGYPATNPVVSPGQAFWLESANGSSATNALLFLGEVRSNASYQVGLRPGLQQIGCGYPVPLNINSNNWIAQGAMATAFNLPARADRIHMWDSGGYSSYFLKTDGFWHDATTLAVASNLVLNPGSGMWYEAKTNFTLTIAKPF